jgi:hypothetical protein
MDSKYIITRLKSSPYKYPTADVLRVRLRNLEQDKKRQIVSNLKMELCRECNTDIYEPLFELLYRLPLAS